MSESDENRSRKEKNKSRSKNNGNKKKKKKKRRIFLLLIMALILLTGGVAFWGYNYLSKFSKGNNDEPNAVATKPVAKNEPVNILVTGVDIGDPKAKSASDPKRTDTIILMHYDPKEESADLVSIPRDTLIKYKGKNEKINSANAYGGEKLLQETVEKLLGVNVNYYAQIDYAGFRAVMDDIGGVDMEITRNMYYDDAEQNLHIHFKKGTVHLDGKKSEEFFRWRENNDRTGLAEGDIGRIKNQQLFISKVIDKVKSPSIIPKVPAILETISKHVKTNMSPSDITSYGLSFTKLDKAKINMQTLQGDAKYVDGVSYFIYDEKKNKDILGKLHADASSSNGNAKAEQVKRQDMKVQVLNGTGKAGFAASYAEELKKLGYANVETGNGQKTKISTVTGYGLDESGFSAIKNDFKIKNMKNVKQKNEKFDIIILLGEDYK